MPNHYCNLRALIRFSLCVIALTALASAQNQSTESTGQDSSSQIGPTEQESQLLAVLRSDAPPDQKAMTCKLLAIHGSQASVAELGRLLADPQLSSWSRIALEVIPDPAADDTLRKASESLEGLLLVGTLNSIGVRRDAQAVEVLTSRLRDSDHQVAAAAAVALGRIGNAAATNSLTSALATAAPEVRSAIAEGCILCAEQLSSAGSAAEAATIYDQVRLADVPKQRKLEALRGLILVHKEEGIPLLIEQLRATDKSLFRLGLSTAREFPGSALDRALAQELDQATPERAAALIATMADRSETVELPAIVKAAKSGPQQVRLAAIAAVGRIGDGSCLSPLLDAALEEDAEIAQAAKRALGDLASEKVDSQIVALLAQPEAKVYSVLLEVVGQRRIDAIPQLTAAIEHADPAVRSAALSALGETVSLQRLPLLIAQALSPKHETDAQVAQRALKAACVRMPDRDACASQLAAALPTASIKNKSLLLRILADVGGTKALETLAVAAKSGTPEAQDTSSELLGKWNSTEAAPVLLELAEAAPNAKYRLRALRGYLGLARKFSMPDEERASMCQRALKLAERTNEQKLVLEVLTIHPSRAGLEIAIQLKQLPAVKAEADQAALTIAHKLAVAGVNVDDLLAGAGWEKVKLEILRGEYGTATTRKDVTELLRKLAGDLPIVMLPSANYNAVFGDPAPNIAKQLTVQYRLNGRLGETNFTENAPIIFPVPE